MPLNPNSLSLVEPYKQGPESFIDGGPARSKTMADPIFDAARLMYGRTKAKFLDCDWVATDKALYYVAYNASQTYRWDWTEIKSMTPSGRGMTRRIDIEFDSGLKIDLRTGRLGTAAILSIFARLS